MDWEEFKLGDILTIKHGYAFKGEFFSEEPTKNVLLTPGNFKIGGGYKDSKLKFYCGVIPKGYIFSAGDVVVTMTDLSKMADTLGYSAKIPNDNSRLYLHNQRIGLVHLLDDSFDLNFLYWLMRTEHYQKFVAGSATGATVKHTSPTKIYAFKFKAPTNKQIQQKFAHILSAYDDLIENNLKRIKLLEEMAQITYEQWFVRMNFPGHETTPIDAETGLPEGWVKTTCFEAMEVLSGGTPKTTIEEYWNGRIKFFTPKDASGGFYTEETEKSITQLGLNKCNSKLYPANTLFITARGTVGKLNLASEPMAMNQSCYALKAKEGITQYFLYCALSKTIDAFKGAASGGVFDTIVVDTFRFLPFVKPLQEMVELFDRQAEPFFRSVKNLLEQNLYLEEARDILLPRLMTGMINVDHIELPIADQVTESA